MSNSNNLVSYSKFSVFKSVVIFNLRSNQKLKKIVNVINMLFVYSILLYIVLCTTFCSNTVYFQLPHRDVFLIWIAINKTHKKFNCIHIKTCSRYFAGWATNKKYYRLYLIYTIIYFFKFCSEKGRWANKININT